MPRPVVYADSAIEDLTALYDYIAPRGSERVARAYVTKIYDYCNRFDIFPERGTARDDIRPGMRTVGYRRRATIVFTVDEVRVTILRVFYAGQAVEFPDDDEG